MPTKDTAYDILLNLNAEGQRNLLGNSGATPSRITPLHFDDCLDGSVSGPFGPGLRLRFGENRRRYFLLTRM